MSSALLRFRMFGTPVEMGWTAALLSLWIATMMSGAGWALIAIHCALIFFSILIHEQGHAIAGRLQGMRVERIVLHGMGGLCEFDRAPQSRQGLITALAGPAAGLALAAMCWVLLLLLGHRLPDIVVLTLAQCVWINWVWSLFNLVPMFPLDGGQALLHGTRLAMGRSRKAIEVTKWVSLGTSILVGIWGYWVWDSTFILIIALLSAVQSWQLGRLSR